MSTRKPKTPATPKAMTAAAEDKRDWRVEAGKPEQALKITRDASKSEHQQLAAASLSPVNQGAISARGWAEKYMGVIGINEAVTVIQERADQAAAGDLGTAKAMLMAQASTLDAIFNEMARRASHLVKVKEDGTWSFPGETMESVTRVAFKAQSQCRATLQTLGELVNPRSVAFIKQANLAQGPQQVNNGAPAPASQKQTPTNELKGLTDGQRLDAGAPITSGAVDSGDEALGAINRAKVGARQGAGSAEQPQARRTVEAGH